MTESYQLRYAQVDVDLLQSMRPAKRRYYLVLGSLFLLILWGAYSWGYQIRHGMGVAGISHPVGWAVYITNFVFWVGIAHSGTLISAILFLFRVRWRASVYRSAEAVTVFGLMTAGLFPIIHVGRPLVVFWALPYPQMGGLFPNFRSPLVWDVLAISTYLTVSLLFFLTGMVPDLAVVRDRIRGWRRKVYGFLAQGWRGSDRQWRHYTSAYIFLAGLATPLVISVHSIVSWDFAMSILPGWHSTIFAPYFVAGAIHSGLAMVILILIPMRRMFNLKAYVTDQHLGNLAKLMVLTAMLVGYAYAIEIFLAWYSGNPYEKGTFLFRLTGPYAWMTWSLFVLNVAVPLFFIFPKVRARISWLMAVAVAVMIGMWLERFVIIVTSLAHDFDPFAWGLYKPTWVEVGITTGSFAWFFFLFLIFAKVLPVVSMWEVKEQLPAH